MAGVLLGAVAYDPKVVTIWEGFRAWFSRRGFDLDVILFTNYERQVEAHLRGHIDVAWNSPLAWLQLERAAERIGRTSMRSQCAIRIAI
jgi:ABC-type phosphate/phosphonate transport system substrate-binding protein